MTKDSAKQLMDNPALKFAGLIITQTIAVCVLYFGLRSEIRENKATQTGIDNVQNTRLDYLENRRDVVATKPEPIVIEGE